VVLPAHYAGFATPFVLLATSTCISAAINATLLWRGLRREGVYRPLPGWGGLIWRVIAANVVMAVGLLALASLFGDWLEASAFTRMWQLAFCVIAGFMAYALALLAMGLRPHSLRL